MYCGSLATTEAAHLAKNTDAGLTPLLELQKGYIAASAGQYLDSDLGQRADASSEESLRMTGLKAGSLGNCAAGFGARLATVDPGLIQEFEEFGWNLFTYAQLIDDLRDAFPEDSPWKDWDQHKKTLPLLFFKESRQKTYRKNEKIGDMIVTRPRDQSNDNYEDGPAGEEAGAQMFGAVVAESFLNRAKSSLANLKKRLPGTVEHLEQLIDSLEITVEGLAPTS